MKMMISILKIVIKVMTIQLTKKKKKIQTNYQNEALCKTWNMCCLSIVVIVLCDGQFSNQNNYLKCHYHRRPYRRTNARRHFTKSWKIITWNVTITDVHADRFQSVIMLSTGHYYRQHHRWTMRIPKSGALNASLTASFCQQNYRQTMKNMEGNTKHWCEIQKLLMDFQNFTDGIN
jgi:hypothetical protein